MSKKSNGMNSVNLLFVIGVWLFINIECTLCVSEKKDCVYLHPQTKFCMTDFAVKAKFQKIIFTNRDKETNVTETKVKFRVEEVLKTPPGYEDWPERKIIKVHLYNVAISWQLDEDYLLTGTQFSKSMKVFECDWVSRWSDLTRMQYRGVTGRYGPNCQCMIDTSCLSASGQNLCIDRNDFGNNKNELLIDDKYTMPLSNQLSCPADVLLESKQKRKCYTEHASCYATSNGGSCRWKTDDDYYAFCINREWLA